MQLYTELLAINCCAGAAEMVLILDVQVVAWTDAYTPRVPLWSPLADHVAPALDSLLICVDLANPGECAWAVMVSTPRTSG